MGYVILIVILQAIICAALASNLAEKKGYSSGAWGVCGFFFGILGLIAAAGLPSRGDLYQRGTILVKICPTCAEPIKIEAQVCKYCGQKFSKEEIISELGIAIEKNANSRLQAVKILAKLQDEIAIPYLEKALSYESDYETRSKATKALLDIGTIAALIGVLKKGEYVHQEEAVKILKERADPSSIPGLLSIIEGDFSTKAEAAEIIGFIGDRSTTPALINLLEKGDYDAKRAAISALARIQDESTIPALISALADRNMRDKATAALIKIGNPSIPYLEEAIKREGKSIRKVIDRIITEIKRKT